MATRRHWHDPSDCKRVGAGLVYLNRFPSDLPEGESGVTTLLDGIACIGVANRAEVLRHGRAALWALAMPVMLLMGLRGGWFTPTELGAVAAV